MKILEKHSWLLTLQKQTSTRCFGSACSINALTALFLPIPLNNLEDNFTKVV